MRARRGKQGREAVLWVSGWSTERSYAAEGFTARKRGEAPHKKSAGLRAGVDQAHPGALPAKRSTDRVPRRCARCVFVGYEDRFPDTHPSRESGL